MMSVADGRIYPGVLEEGFIGVRGSMVIEENGVVSLKLDIGQCGGSG